MPPLDLSQIDFDTLAERFKKMRRKKAGGEVLRAAIAARLKRMVQQNRTRIDFMRKFKELIESYNLGSRSIEEVYKGLLELSNSLNAEEERHLRENLSEEELVIFDILLRPAPELTERERDVVKGVVRELLVKIKEQLVLNWR